MKKIAQIIGNTNQQFATLVANEGFIRRLKSQLELLDIFSAHKTNYKIIKFSQGILYLSVSSAAFATQIRHMTPAVLHQLQTQLPEIELHAIHCKVSHLAQATPKFSAAQKNINQHKIKIISEKTKKNIFTLADKLSSAGLREALKRLAK